MDDGNGDFCSICEPIPKTVFEVTDEDRGGIWESDGAIHYFDREQNSWVVVAGNCDGTWTAVLIGPTADPDFLGVEEGPFHRVGRSFPFYVDWSTVPNVDVDG